MNAWDRGLVTDFRQIIPWHVVIKTSVIKVGAVSLLDAQVVAAPPGPRDRGPRGSVRLIDELFARGAPERIARRIAEHLNAGANWPNCSSAIATPLEYAPGAHSA